MTIFLRPPIDTRGLPPCEVEEPHCAEGRRRVAHHSVKKCTNASAAGRSCGGMGKWKGRRARLEEYLMRDFYRRGERVQGGFEES